MIRASSRPAIYWWSATSTSNWTNRNHVVREKTILRKNLGKRRGPIIKAIVDVRRQQRFLFGFDRIRGNRNIKRLHAVQDWRPLRSAFVPMLKFSFFCLRADGGVSLQIRVEGASRQADGEAQNRQRQHEAVPKGHFSFCVPILWSQEHRHQVTD